MKDNLFLQLKNRTFLFCSIRALSFWDYIKNIVNGVGVALGKKTNVKGVVFLPGGFFPLPLPENRIWSRKNLVDFIDYQ